MPSVPLLLPAHVVLRHRKDGTTTIYWLLNKRDQVPGLGSCIRLPIDPERRGPIEDPRVLAAVIADANRLNAELKAAKAGLVKGDAPGSIEDVIARWRKTASYAALKPRSKRYYGYAEAYVLALFDTLRSRQVDKLQPTQVRAFLESPELSATAAKDCRALLSVIMSYAVELRLVDVNPVQLLRKSKSIRPITKKAIELWTPEDVDQYVNAAEAMGWIGGAIAILGAWESQSRWFDTPQWTRAHWDASAGFLEYRTGKSDGRYDAVGAMSQRFADLVAKAGSFVLVTRPDGVTPYVEGRDDTLLTGDFNRLRAAVVAAGGRALVARHIRHSSLTHGEVCGLSPTNMSVASTHTNTRTTTKHYIQKNRDRALANAEARGIR
jgi:hypothetical protein